MATLVVCYSRSGTARKAAQYLAQKMTAEIEVIETVDQYQGFFGMLRGLFATMGGKQPLIVMGLQAAKFDRAILLAPIWAGKVASPMHTWVAKQFGRDKELVLVTVSSSGNGERGARDLAERHSVAFAHTYHVTGKAVKEQPLDEVFAGLLGKIGE